MPFLGRDKGRSPRSRRSDDEFVVFLQGIPAHCRWQELKDLVRQTALHIRQAVVYDDSHGFPTGLGQIIVKNEDEAWRTYHRLSTIGWDGQSLVVTLARTSAPTKPIAGPTRSPPAVAVMQNFTPGHTTPPQSQGNITVPPSPISPDSINSASSTYSYPDYAPMMGPMAISTQHFMPMMPDPMAPPMHCFPPSPLMHSPMYDNQGWNMVPMYSASPLQLFHDAGDDYARQHSRKPCTNCTEPNSPTSDSNQRAVYIPTSRSRSWDSAMTTSEDLSVPDLEFNHQSLGIGKSGQEIQSSKTVDPNKPLVVDGSGTQKRSLELLSTSAPS